MKPTNSQFIPGRVASKTPFLFSAHDLSVWKKGAGGWQWISHANLASIP